MTPNNDKVHSYSVYSSNSLLFSNEVMSDLNSNLLMKKPFVCEASNDWTCPDNYVKLQDRCFGIVDQNLTYLQADLYCERFNDGQLASIDNHFLVSISHSTQKAPDFIFLPFINRPYSWKD